MTIDLRKVQFTTKARSFLNEPSTTGSIVTSAVSVGVGGYTTFSTSVPLSRSDGTTQVLQNYSFDSSKYYVGNFLQVEISVSFRLQTRIYIDGSDLKIDLYVINTTGGALNSPVFTANFEVRRFVTPFI